MERRKHVRDLAPFASSEDLSDERESPLDEQKQKPKLENIQEEMKTPPRGKLNVSSVTPRIDISRASSSSHQDDSSPERELFAGKGKATKLELAFGEEMASELHSSTEELFFHETDDYKNKNKRKKSSQGLSDLQPEPIRKDSACSDIALLSISGRTSRVSSIGSVASAGSGISSYSGVSHCSAISHLSATSNLSRNSSPHRVSVETSFCGPKPVHTASLDVEDAAKCIRISDKLRNKTEEVTLTKEKKKLTHQSRISAMEARSTSNCQTSSATTKDQQQHLRHKRKKPPIENPKTQKFISLHSDEEEEPIASRLPKSKPQPAPEPVLDTLTQIYIPLKGTGSFDQDNTKCEPNPNSPKRLKPFTNATILNFIKKYDPEKDYAIATRGSRRAKSATEAEYQSKREIHKEFQLFISLKDEDDYSSGQVKHVRSASAIHTMSQTPRRNKETESKPLEKASSSIQITVPIQVHHTASSPIRPENEGACRQDFPKYLMTNDGTTQYIPLRGSDTEIQTKSVNKNYLCVSQSDLKSRSDDHNLSHLATSNIPNLDRHGLPSSLELGYRDHTTRSTQSMTQLVNVDHSRTPSPNASMHKNYGTTNTNGNSHQNYLYRRCSESAKEIHSIGKSKSRSGSFRSLFSTIFKRSGSTKHRKNSKADVSQISTTSTTSEYYSKPLQSVQPKKIAEPETIIIPLHSPSDEINSSNLKDSKKDEDVTNATRMNRNKNSSNRNDTINSSIIPTVIKVEYSEQKTDEDVIKAQEIDFNKCKFEKYEEKEGLENRSNECVKPHQVECEVTVHNDGRSTDENQIQNEKLEKTDTVDSSDSNTQDHQCRRELNKTDTDSDSRNSLVDSQPAISCQSIKVALEENGGDMSTDSDKPTIMAPHNADEHKNLMNQEESFEELPYVPTTLPQERSVALPIIPIKERVSEIITRSIDRPRSATPLNLLLLETYAISQPSVTSVIESSSNEKLHITLPRTDVLTDSPKKRYSSKSLTPSSNVSKRHHSISTYTAESSPPPLPPRKSSMSWIAFDDNSHESRQSPKRITTLPRSYAVEGVHPDSCTRSNSNQKFVFVNSDECLCECHGTTQNTPIKKTAHKHGDSMK